MVTNEASQSFPTALYLFRTLRLLAVTVVAVLMLQEGDQPIEVCHFFLSLLDLTLPFICLYPYRFV